MYRENFLPQRRRLLRRLAGAAWLAGAAGLLPACSEQQAKFSAIDLTGANYARDFSLTDHNGQPRRLKDFAGKVVVLFFGYTQCADVCPTAMTELAEVKRLLGPDGARVQGLFVTVDPQRDTPPVLKAYMANFDPGFLALYAGPDQLAALAQEFKVYYKKVDGPTPTSYTMDHSAGHYVYDPRGQLRLFTRQGSGAAALAADIRILLQQTT